MEMFCLVFSRFLAQVMSERTDEEILLILFPKHNTKNVILIRSL